MIKYIDGPGGRMKLIVLHYGNGPGILWIHGGGYATGMPAHASDYRGLPPCYTYVEDGEPFYDETLTYVRRLTEAGIDARADVYHGKTHGFDGLLWTRNATRARRKLMEEADRLMKG